MARKLRSKRINDILMEFTGTVVHEVTSDIYIMALEIDTLREELAGWDDYEC